MKEEPVLSRITIYPVKSLDGMVLQKAMISDGGCLLHDREFAMSDKEGNFIIGKSNPLIHKLRSTVDFETGMISFRHQDENKWNQFHLENEKSALHSYLSDFFSTPIILQQNNAGRFMDIPDIAGVTVLAASSLQSVAAWYPGMSLEETRQRFRATLEIENVPAFWEDHLFSKEGTGVEFKVGDVTIYGMSPRARCVVPTRHPETGEIIHAFPKTFARHRSESLPSWSRLKEYGHSYHLTVNCYVPASEKGKWVQTGDLVTIIGEKIFYI
ncbi:MAG: MOSC N-terminal beta barrel domain-containing protein [Bacteroidetes bacterium]|nr:MOSC N-terminal beta barrel domain-containing protein [Bacteroidota bacterium]